MLRQFVESTKSGEDGSPLQKALWIYTPDYDNQGQINSIQNITVARSQYASYWTDLEVIKTIQQAQFPLGLNQTQQNALQNWLNFDQI